jgi:hypothetical protein
MSSISNAALTLLLLLQAAKAAPALHNMHRTVYSTETEFYAEFQPLIVGQSDRVTAHLTKVGDRFRAYTEGRVTLTLTVEGTPVEVAAQGPERVGVFRLPTIPTKAGHARMTFAVTEGGTSETFTFDDVTVYPDVQTALAQQPPDETAGLVKYSKENAWDQDFATAPVKKTGAVLTVPQTAVIQDAGAARVYVQRTPEAYEFRQVKAGKLSGATIEIVEGLKDGERIVIKGGDKMPRK